MKTRTALLALLAALAVVAAACGDSGDDTTTTTVTAPPLVETSTTTLPSTTTTLPAETTTTTTTQPPGTSLPASDIFVTTAGLDEIRVGMTIEQAEAASEIDLVGEPDPDVNPDCYFVEPQADGYEGVSFMVLNDRIARVDIQPPSPITTRSGAGIGTTEQTLNELFPGRIQDAAEFTIDGPAVMFVPADESDAQFRVIFELDDAGTVLNYRSGILPGVGFGEGCA